MTQPGVERATRTALRCGVRALVVAGFASAAWLLSTSAAQAAAENGPAAPAQIDLPVLHLVSDLSHEVLGTDLPRALAPVAGTAKDAVPVTRVGSVPCLELASAPAGAPAEVAPVAPSSTMDTRAAAASCGSTPARSSGPAAPAGGGLVRILRGLVAPLDLGTVATGLVSPLTRALEPVIDPLAPVLRPVTSTLDAAVSRVRAGRGANVAHLRSASTPAPVAVHTNGLPVRVAALTVAAEHAAYPGTSAAGPTAGVAFRAAQPRGPGGTLPQLPEPAPLKSPLSTGSGLSTNGSGTHTDGGSFAVVISSAVAGAVASHHRSSAADVAVPRRDAEDPTFSPD